MVSGVGQDRAAALRVEAGRTIGVEEEFLVADAVSRNTVPRAGEVLARASRGLALAAGATLQAELAGSQVEAATGVCVELDALRAQLVSGRRRLAEAAQAEGLLLTSTGSPVLPHKRPTTSTLGDSERFRRIADAYAGAIPDYQACGCHVHVGVPDRDTAVAVVNHLRLWLPALLSLSVNSPFDYGQDTGYGSWRIIQLSRFPTAGVPPWCASASAYDDQLARLVDCGVLVDTAMTFWLARPSSRLPTVEIRAADAAITVDEAVLHAGVSRALVRTALAELERGREAPVVREPVLAAALWSAARYGLTGPAVHPLAERRAPATALLDELITWISPALEDTGDLALVRRLAASVVRGGAGASRQRRAAVAGPAAVVDMLAAHTNGAAAAAAADQAETARRAARAYR